MVADEFYNTKFDTIEEMLYAYGDYRNEQDSTKDRLLYITGELIQAMVIRNATEEEIVRAMQYTFSTYDEYDYSFKSSIAKDMDHLFEKYFSVPLSNDEKLLIQLKLASEPSIFSWFEEEE